MAREVAAPPGAKGAAVEWGTLLVGVLSSGALTALVTTAGSWLGRQRGVWLYLGLAAAGIAVAIAGVVAGAFPVACLAIAAAVPLLVSSGRNAVRTYASPREFVPAIRAIVGCYLLAVALFGTGVLARSWAL